MQIQLETAIIFTAASVFELPPAVFITAAEIRLFVTPIPWTLASVAGAVPIHGGRNAAEEVAAGGGETNLTRRSREP
jgi:hypothetical protein